MSEFVESDPVGYLVAGTFLKGTSLENDESDRAKMFDPLLQSVVRSQQARVVHALQRKQAMRNGLKDYKIDAFSMGLLARSFARSLARFIHYLAPRCSLCSRIPVFRLHIG